MPRPRAHVLLLAASTFATSARLAQANSPTSLEIGWPCASNGEGGTYAQAGNTYSGAPYYEGASGNAYIYYDPGCNGGSASGRWIMDAEAPSTTASMDLDGDGACSYIGDLVSTSPEPVTGFWDIACGGSWSKMLVTINEPAPPSTVELE